MNISSYNSGGNKFLVFEALVRRHDLSDMEFSILLKYALMNGGSYKAVVYRKILQEAVRFGYSQSILRKMKYSIKNLCWVYRICQKLLENQGACGR